MDNVIKAPTRNRGIQMMVLSATLVSTSGLIFRSFDNIDVFEIVFFSIGSACFSYELCDYLALQVQKP